MDAVAEFYLDNAGILFLAAFLAATVALFLAARSELPRRWWIGAGVAALGMVGTTTVIASALAGLDSGSGGGISPEGWFAIAVAGALGAVAGMDVQLAIGQARGRQGGLGAIIAGAIGGPVVVVAGYLLLVRSMEWIRFGGG